MLRAQYLWKLEVEGTLEESPASVYKNYLSSVISNSQLYYNCHKIDNMRNFKMKDLMIRIQPDSGGLFLNGHLLAQPGCTTPTCVPDVSTCSSAQSCKPSACPKKPPKPKHGYEQFDEDVIELTELKSVLAQMQINLARRTSEIAEMI